MAYFAAACTLIAGCVVGGEGVKIGVRVRRMLSGNRVRGTMVSHQERMTRNGNRSLLFPVIEFVAPGGETLRFTDAVTAAKWAVGRECVVAYAQADPAGTAVLVRPNSIVGLLVCTIFSLAFFASAFWLLSGGLPS